MKDLPDGWREVGEFIREQRNNARLSVRRLSELAGVSNPYLSQIERGLRHPSAEILQQIAKGLRISAETLYVRAGILEAREATGDLPDAILADPTLRDDQKQTLLRIYLSFRRENDSGPAQAEARDAIVRDAVGSGAVGGGAVGGGAIGSGAAAGDAGGEGASPRPARARKAGTG